MSSLFSESAQEVALERGSSGGRGRVALRPWLLPRASNSDIGRQDVVEQPAPGLTTRVGGKDADAVTGEWSADEQRLNTAIANSLNAVMIHSIADDATNAIVGSATLRWIDPTANWLLADYTLSPGIRGEDYAVDALHVLAAAAADLGARRVEFRTRCEDLDRVKAALRAGFRFEGVLRTGHRKDGAGGLAVFARVPHGPARPIPFALPELPPGGLGDGVVSLRVALPGDAAALYLDHTNDEAKRWSLFDTCSEAEMAERVARAGLEWLVGPTGLMVIVDDETGEVAGRVVMRAVVPPHVADVGYSVLPAFRGRGYSARALRIMSAWAFETARYARLELGVKPNNAASRAVAEAAGFHFDGLRHARLRNLDGTFSDELHYSLVNPACRMSAGTMSVAS